MSEITLRDKNENGTYDIDYIDGSWLTAYNVEEKDALKINEISKFDFFDFISKKYGWI